MPKERPALTRPTSRFEKGEHKAARRRGQKEGAEGGQPVEQAQVDPETGAEEVIPVQKEKPGSRMVAANNADDLEVGSNAASVAGKGQKRGKGPYLKYEELPRSSPLDHYFDLEKNNKQHSKLTSIFCKLTTLYSSSALQDLRVGSIRHRGQGEADSHADDSPNC